MSNAMSSSLQAARLEDEKMGDTKGSTGHWVLRRESVELLP